MNLELDLLELNALYVAVSNHVKKTQRDAEQYPSDFFETQATLTEMLAEKIQTALYETCEELDVNFEGDDDEEWVVDEHQEMVNELLSDLKLLESELAYYVKVRDFRTANEISERLDELQEQLDNLSK